MRYFIDSPDLANQGVDILLKDDHRGTSNSCASATSDCYAWDPSTGEGSFAHKWARCCTDGMVLGPLPETDFCFNMRYDLVQGIERFRIGSIADNGIDMDLIAVPWEAAEDGIVVCGQTCSDYCTQFDTCGSCSSDSACSWCPGQGCVAEHEVDSTCSDDGTIAETCADCGGCSVHTSLEDCAAVDGCGWCFASGSCLAANEDTPCSGDCADLLPLWWRPDFEVGDTVGDLTCPGAVDSARAPVDASTDPVDQWCNARGVCVVGGRAFAARGSGEGQGSNDDFDGWDWHDLPRQCACDTGFGGADCSVACPTHDGEPCGGRGRCTADGICACDCGYTGTNCADETLCERVVQDDGGEMCEIGENCDQLCGRSLNPPNLDEAWSGSGVDGCLCAPGWLGDQCDIICPGVDWQTGLGSVCGGHGTCYLDESEEGACACDPCHEFNPSTGHCEAMECPDCRNGGVCYCDAEANEMSCHCAGQFGGYGCFDCLCENQDQGARCNSITGECVCPDGFYGERCSDLPVHDDAPCVAENFDPEVNEDDTTDEDSEENERRNNVADLMVGESFTTFIPVTLHLGMYPGLFLDLAAEPGLRIVRAEVPRPPTEVDERCTMQRPFVDFSSDPQSTASLSFGDVYLDHIPGSSEEEEEEEEEEENTSVDIYVTVEMIAVDELVLEERPTDARLNGIFRITNEEGGTIDSCDSVLADVDLVFPVLEVEISMSIDDNDLPGPVPGLLQSGHTLVFTVHLFHADDSTAAAYSPEAWVKRDGVDGLPCWSVIVEILDGPNDLIDEMTITAAPSGEATQLGSIKGPDGPGARPLYVNEEVEFTVTVVLGEGLLPFEELSFSGGALGRTQPSSSPAGTSLMPTFSDQRGGFAMAPSISVEATTASMSFRDNDVADLAVGEVATVDVHVQLPNGITPIVVQVDIPATLAVVDSRVSHIGVDVSSQGTPGAAVLVPGLEATSVPSGDSATSLVWAVGRLGSDLGSTDGDDFVQRDGVTFTVDVRLVTDTDVSLRARVFFSDALTSHGTEPGPQLPSPCPANWYGPDCDTPCDAESHCSGHGICDQRYGSCWCDQGWGDSDCDSHSDDTPTPPFVHTMADTVALELVEPSLDVSDVESSADSAVGNDEVDLTVVISNADDATANAHHIVLRDASAEAGGLYTIVEATYEVGGSGLLSAVVEGNEVRLPDGVLDLDGDDVTVTWTVRIAEGLAPGQCIVSSLTVIYESAARDGATVLGAVSRVRPDEQASILIDGTGFALELQGDGSGGSAWDAPVGSLLTLTATVVLPVATVPDAEVVLIVPADSVGVISFVTTEDVVVTPSSADVTSSCGADWSSRVTSVTSDEITLDLCDLSNGDDDGDLQRLSIVATLVVADAEGTTEGTDFSVDGTFNGDTLSAEGEVGPEPSLSVLLLARSEDAEDGVEISTGVTFPVQVEVSGDDDVDAYDVNAQLLIPYPELTVDVVGPGTHATLVDADGNPRSSGDPGPLFMRLSASSAILRAGQTLTLDARVTASVGADVGTVFDLDASVSWQSTPSAASAQPRSYELNADGELEVECDPTDSCGNRGVCNGDGECVCDAEYDGDTCNECNEDSFNACNNAGECDDGVCVCDDTSSGTWCEDSRVGAPVIQPAGGRFPDSVEVSMTAQDGATIHYIVLGRDDNPDQAPTEASTVYEGPFTLGVGYHVVRAIATHPDSEEPSVVATRVFNVLARAATPELVPGDLTIVYPSEIGLISATDSCAIYFTLDGSSPSRHSPVYDGPMLLPPGTHRLRAVTLADGFWRSYELDVEILVLERVEPPTTSPSPDGGPFQDSVSVTLESETESAGIWYTLDGSEAEESGASSSLFTSDIELSAGVTVINAIAVKEGMADSHPRAFTFDVWDTVDDVVISLPGPGPFVESVEVQLSTATEGADIYYTTDDSVPSRDSRAYSGPFTITNYGVTHIHARAFKAGMFPSSTTEDDVTVLRQVATPIIHPTSSGPYSPSVTVEITCATGGAEIRWTSDGSDPASGTVYSGPFNFALVGTYTIRAIATRSDWGDSEIAEQDLVVQAQVEPVTFDPNGGAHPPETTITLETATDGATIYYTTDPDADLGDFVEYTEPVDVETATFRAYATKDGMGDSTVSRQTFSEMDVVEPPIFDPDGGTFVLSVDIDIECATAGSTTYYTTDGSTPTDSSTEYTGTITWTTIGTTTFKAISVKDGDVDSPVVTAVFVILDKVATPEFSVDPEGSGPWTNSATITITTATPDAEIRYTTDSSEPHAGSVLYEGPFEWTALGDTHFRAFALKDGMADSDEGELDIEIWEQIDPPVFSATPQSAPYCAEVTVCLECPDDGVTIYYTLDGSDPDEWDEVYTECFTIDWVGDHEVRAIAVRDGCTQSEVVSRSYPVLEVAGYTTWDDERDEPWNGEAVVDLECETDDSTIWWSLDGEEIWRAYTEPLVFDQAGEYTIRAVCRNTPAMCDGPEAEFWLEVLQKTSPPLITVEADEGTLGSSSDDDGEDEEGNGSEEEEQEGKNCDYDIVAWVTVYAVTPDSVLHCSTDGSRPTRYSRVVEDGVPFAITRDGDTDVRCIAIAPGHGPSKETKKIVSVCEDPDGVIIQNDGPCPGPHLYGPDCKFCHTSLTCSDAGSCSRATGECVCNIGRRGEDCSGEARCHVQFGVPGEYSVFIQDDFDRVVSGSRILGALAVGGNADLRNCASVGDSLPRPHEMTGPRVALGIGGECLNFESGTVYGGDVYVGHSWGSSMGFTVARPDLQRIIRGHPPIDFEVEFARLCDLSSYLAGLTTTGTTRREWSEFHLVGTRTDVNIFTITTTQLFVCRGLYLELPDDMDANHAVIINVVSDHDEDSEGVFATHSGYAMFHSFGMFGAFHRPNMEAHVLFNFPHTNDLWIDAIEVRGHVLAPFAEVEFRNGNILGSIFAHYFTGEGVLGWSPWAGCGDAAADLGSGVGEWGEDPDDIPPECGENGDWIGNGCRCNGEWRGELCEERCVDNCNGRGNCRADDRDKCQCWKPDWFYGDHCELSHCGRNGFVRALDDNGDPICICTTGWGGDRCEERLPCVYGRWDSGVCDCHEGWMGEACDSPIEIPPGDLVCDHGVMQLDGTCMCQIGYEGEACDNFVGVWPQLDHFTCYRGHWLDDESRCVCEVGWYGPHCDARRCINGSPAYDSASGDEVCHCDDGWTGDNCDVSCRGECYHRGSICEDGFEGECVCDHGYTGLYCQEVDCPADGTETSAEFGGDEIVVTAEDEDESEERRRRVLTNTGGDAAIFISNDPAPCEGDFENACISAVLDVDFPGATFGDDEDAGSHRRQLRSHGVRRALPAEGSPVSDAVTHATRRALQEGESVGVAIVIQLPCHLIPNASWVPHLVPLEDADSTSHADYTVSGADADACNAGESFDADTCTLHARVCYAGAYRMDVVEAAEDDGSGAIEGPLSAAPARATGSMVVTTAAALLVGVLARRIGELA